MKRAAIYIRVSSEGQADKVSPIAQTADCRELCEHKGYQVVEVYEDTEKYRVGKRLVEPSGTRADRPQLKRMLADARAGRFDVIVAWREDRLYRSSRPMVDVIDMLDETKVDIELVKETFDKRIAPVKAWAGKMELDAKHDRFMMGVAGRLEKGLGWNNPAPYGYQRIASGAEAGTFVVLPEEAQWIQKLFRWYAEGVALLEIRRRFIATGAPQRKQENKWVWHLGMLRRFLRTPYYWIGYKVVKWNGKQYEIPMPPLVSEEEAQIVQDRRATYKHYPAGNAKHDCLAAGLVFCAACGAACRVATIDNGYTRKRDGVHTKKTSYECGRFNARSPEPLCVKRKSVKPIDAQIWGQLYADFANPDEWRQKFQRYAANLDFEEAAAEKEIDQLQKELDEMLLKRQHMIALEYDGIITREDLAIQLLGLDIAAEGKKNQIKLKKKFLAQTGDQKTAAVTLMVDDISAAMTALNVKPENEEQAKEQAANRRTWVSTLIERVWLDDAGNVTLKRRYSSDEIVDIEVPSTYYLLSDPIQFFLNLTL
jgi:DNA invertase Pin-like site-specific DNA recombinase